MDDQNMEIDDENDRVYNVNFVGNKIRGLYEGSGWNTGTIKYYNSKLDKYLLAFDDGSDDLFREEDIDDVEFSLWTNQKGLRELITVQWPRAIKPKSQNNWWC